MGVSIDKNWPLEVHRGPYKSSSILEHHKALTTSHLAISIDAHEDFVDEPYLEQSLLKITVIWINQRMIGVFGNCCFKSSDSAIKSILTSMNPKRWKNTFVLQAIWRYEQPQTFETTWGVCKEISPWRFPPNSGLYLDPLTNHELSEASGTAMQRWPHAAGHSTADLCRGLALGCWGPRMDIGRWIWKFCLVTN